MNVNKRELTVKMYRTTVSRCPPQEYAPKVNESPCLQDSAAILRLLQLAINTKKPLFDL